MSSWLKHHKLFDMSIAYAPISHTISPLLVSGSILPKAFDPERLRRKAHNQTPVKPHIHSRNGMLYKVQAMCRGRSVGLNSLGPHTPSEDVVEIVTPLGPGLCKSPLKI